MNTTQGLIGVIVPVYKVEKYIAECIESILAQPYTNFRLILVDDGTPDGAGLICDEYAKKDPRITVNHQENAGVTRARARGVEEATDCEFITFVDSDDTLPETALKDLHEGMTDESDIVITAVDEYIPKGIDLFSAIEYRNLLLKDVSLCNSPWSKLFRKSLFNEKAFYIPKDIKVGEDLLMNLFLAFNSNKNIRIIHHRTYNYRIHDESVMRTYTRTIESEATFYKKLREIVFEWQDYAILTIDTRLLRFRNFSKYKYSVKNIFNSEFYTKLKEDIKNTGYPIKGFDKFLFYNQNIILRFFIINIIKCLNFIQKK